MVGKLWTYERDPGGDSFTRFFNHFVNFAYIQIFPLTTQERKNKPEAVLVNHEPEKNFNWLCWINFYIHKFPFSTRGFGPPTVQPYKWKSHNVYSEMVSK